MKIKNAAERLNFDQENINIPQGNFITTKGSGHTLNKENQDPGILQFIKLAESPGSIVGKRRKGESEQSQELTDCREAVES